MRAIELTAFGGPEGLRVVERPEPVAGPGQVLVDVRAAGINFADLSRREGAYDRRLEPPLILGAEVAGVRRDLGTRVVALTGGFGGYAEVAAVDAALTFPVPDRLADAPALALLLQGLTAYHLLRTAAELEYGDTVVVHAAAGGVGSLAVQLAGLWGAGRIIGVASTPEKRERVLELGADVAIDATVEGLADRIRVANGGRRVDVILEMVGGEVFARSLSVLADAGRIVTFGSAGRAPRTTSDPREAGFSLPELFADPDRRLRAPLEELFEAALAGLITFVAGGAYAFADVRRAHLDLAARRTTGKLVLIPPLSASR